MIFPVGGGADDGRSVFVKILNTSSEPLAPKQTVLVPDQAKLMEDSRYIQSCIVRVDHDWILPKEYGLAKLLAATLYAD